MIPILIPLGIGSNSDNDELKILLRSIEKNVSNLDKIYIITTAKPDWLNESADVVIVPMRDKWTDNKDANLFDKVHTTIKKFDIEQFCFCADDNVFAQPIDLATIPVLHNHRDLQWFNKNVGGKWTRRVKDTLLWAKNRGVELPNNFECHAPQLFDGKAIINGMVDVDYIARPLTIYTAWRAVTDTWHNSTDQREFKNTYEIALYDDYKQDDLCTKPFIGYSDSTFLNGLRERLFKVFKEKSHYER